VGAAPDQREPGGADVCPDSAGGGYAFRCQLPLGRIAEPDDLRNGVLFLVSPASDFITGQTIYLDGGITATQ
jgi:NAD(P)-dependent dehydrogenase (short-subunit alcohol dehydrogenase family)